MYGSSTLYGVSTDRDAKRSRGRGRHRPDQPLEPIWARSEPRGRRAPRSREDVAEAAIAVADTEGFEAVSMRRVASELGLGTMSLYHYVRSKDELLDLMSDGIMAGQLVDDGELRRGWRAGLTAIAHATRSNFERHPWMGAAMRPRAGTAPGPNGMRHVDQSLAAVADIGTDIATRMEIIALVDDYVIGFVLRTQAVADATAAESADDPEWMKTVFDYLRRELETGAYPSLQRELDANRAAGGTDEGMARMALDEGRFERGLERILDGIEAGLERKTVATRRRGR
jgi:AcrR family transcriptional regulator